MAETFARSKQRVEATPGWQLHGYPYKETSLIVDIFTRDHGRVALVARGARRPTSALRGNLMAFQPLRVSWFGSGELKTLHAAEWQGGVPQLSGLALICGFYLNELLIKLLAREDPAPGLFDAYSHAVGALSMAPADVEPILRRFELALINELGYGFALDQDAQGRPVQPLADYRYLSGKGILPVAETRAAQGVTFQGATLMALASGGALEPQAALQAKQLMRGILGELLADAPLHTRKILRDLHKL
ncbi:DNA repair protein RecO [Chitinimonas sp. BJYL2]|uniref:DNA repair protein RecO n=1 Tax=Chitinimonas sp. BJYL2 TaxID=2976696 RepID=UPI0022B3F8EA|nr:DNA repair protein RecO [Chitinimonas sp. BJYL2]